MACRVGRGPQHNQRDRHLKIGGAALEHFLHPASKIQISRLTSLVWLAAYSNRRDHRFLHLHRFQIAAQALKRAAHRKQNKPANRVCRLYKARQNRCELIQAHATKIHYDGDKMHQLFRKHLSPAVPRPQPTAHSHA